jgi:SAM-dependent methyltransferase
MKRSVKETKDVNERQSRFYDIKNKNFATKIWYSLRNGVLQKIRRKIGAEQQIKNLHLSWLGDLSDKKVLDLGCYAGNSLSMYLAQNSKEYIAIDLSDRGISRLRARLKGINNAKALTIDFLSPEFEDKDFDLIYAYGVLHHFKNIDELIERLKDKLTRKGTIISYDPLQTSLPVKIVRTIYRPFQTDRDWEWPFSKKTYDKFNNSFKIMERRGMLGAAKWALLLFLIPSSQNFKLKLIQKWHIRDWDKSNTSNKILFSCMHLTMHMQKTEDKHL